MADIKRLIHLRRRFMQIVLQQTGAFIKMLRSGRMFRSIGREMSSVSMVTGRRRTHLLVAFHGCVHERTRALMSVCCEVQMLAATPKLYKNKLA